MSSKRRHRKPIEDALRAFCRDFTGRDDGWHVETWHHPITNNVHAAVVAPEFQAVETRSSVVTNYLRKHLETEHFVNLSMVKALTPEEYEETDWAPSYPTLSLSAT